ncbi:alpha-L-fucosidase [Tunturiibacter empetritectus]|uniref:alpha-L-fucosidase n=2 Tax=Tunturiibacter TaxID=3154218 RepID=A0A852VG44_9BACT|nr:alpha-L-fucosidase [Edaphobacter lichenicola]NYF90201.1 alpha-L-fucosidase [Edaphobacter lichenicola]
MKLSRRGALGLLAGAGQAAVTSRLLGAVINSPANPVGRVATSLERTLAKGPFEPTWKSLKAHYETPDWFRDAKFGIWAHWTAQCVPEQGDWYARRMYLQGDPAYDYHVKNYGHPSKVGFKDIDIMWKAERWDPEALMDLYQAAGAKYFMALANHHDNFDNYKSKYHDWNSTRVGPMKDIVGTWGAICKRRGLRYGVSNHSAHAWHWFQTAYGYDAEGPLAGVRYDGFTKKSLVGLNPQELYVGPNLVVPDGFTSAQKMLSWHNANDRVWDEFPPADNPDFTNTWFLRCRDLLDTYKPDMLYFDDTGLPLGQTGVDITTHFYNSNMALHGGRNEAVVFGKEFVPQHRGAAALDLERGRSNDILPLPWQTDTCIGDWHYSREVFEQHKYKYAKTVIHLLADVVSKNGNLCLNIPLKGDGTIDSDERQILADLAAWMPINGEAIFGTRPFTVYGEGPPDPVKTGNFNEGNGRPYTSEDMRFTVKDGRLYVIALGWPADSKLKIKTFARGSKELPSEISKVEMLGVGEPCSFERNSNELVVKLPTQKPNDIAYGFRIEVSRLNTSS